MGLRLSSRSIPYTAVKQRELTPKPVKSRKTSLKNNPPHPLGSPILIRPLRGSQLKTEKQKNRKTEKLTNYIPQAGLAGYRVPRANRADP